MSIEEVAKKLDVTIEKVKRVGEAFIPLTKEQCLSLLFYTYDII